MLFNGIKLQITEQKNDKHLLIVSVVPVSRPYDTGKQYESHNKQILTEEEVAGDFSHPVNGWTIYAI